MIITIISTSRRLRNSAIGHSILRLYAWFMSGVHMEPAQSLRAFLDLCAENMLAIHWGTFDLADEPMDEPPRLLRAAADSLGIDPARAWILRPGQRD
jgi:L-ascorbate metabolism protein UlaG (beta-lactamase superfamily)